MKFLTLLLFLIVISKGVVVYGQSTTNCFNDGFPCNKLNGILAPCNGAFGSPPANVSTTYVYSVDNVNLASCMCNQNAYDTLSSCVSCYSSVNNSNVKIAEFPNYQKSCKEFGHAFGKPLKKEKPDTVDKIKFVLIGAFILLFIIGGLSLLFWYRRRSKRMSKEKEKEENEKKKENRESLSRIERPTSRNSLQEASNHHQFSGNERSISRNSSQEMSVYQTFSGSSERPISRNSLQEASVHHQFSGNEIPISLQEASAHQPSSGTERSTSRNSSSSSEGLLYNPDYRRYSPPSPIHTGLFPPPGTIHQYSIPGNRPNYTPTSPRYNVPIPTPPLQMYLPQQPQQPQQPSQPPPFQSSAQMLPRPPVRNSYQHPNYYNRGRNLPSPPHNYNANNYYGGY